MNVTGRPEEPESGSCLHKWLFLFGLCFAIWHICPVFLGFEIRNKFTLGDLVDLTTPYVLIGLVLKLYLLMRQQSMEMTGRVKASAFVYLLFFFGIITFIEGHGIHLSSNAIYRHLGGSPTSPLSSLTYFFDEIQGHIFWDAGLLLMAFALILLGFSSETSPKCRLNQGWVWAGALLYGFTHFTNGIEGQTVMMTFPAAILIPVLLLAFTLRKRISLSRRPVVLFYLVAFLTADIFFTIWGVLNKGFPQFSELGWF